MKTLATDGGSPADLVLDTVRAMQAAPQTVHRTLLTHKPRGDPIGVWENGHPKWISSADIVVTNADLPHE